MFFRNPQPHNYLTHLKVVKFNRFTLFLCVLCGPPCSLRCFFISQRTQRAQSVLIILCVLNKDLHSNICKPFKSNINFLFKFTPGMDSSSIPPQCIFPIQISIFPVKEAPSFLEKTMKRGNFLHPDFYLTYPSITLLTTFTICVSKMFCSRQ